MAQAIIYINGADTTFTATEPDLTGKAIIDLAIPDGLPLSFGIQQLNALQNQYNFPGDNLPDYSLIVFRVTIGSA